ncbi:MAG: Ig-like domain-containing protein [Pirellulaceae bacterium]
MTIEDNDGGTVIINNVSNDDPAATVVFNVKNNRGLATKTPVNDVPSFKSLPVASVNEDAGFVSIDAFASEISAGADPNESDQKLHFEIIGNGNPTLFAVPPAIDANGRLTFTPADDKSGSAQISVILVDDGGTDDGGVDRTEARQFTIDIVPVNDAPKFTLADDPTPVSEDAPQQTINNFAHSLLLGPADEAGQVGQFEIVGNTNPDLLASPPVITPSGTLVYSPAADQHGTTTISVRLRDDGGTENGGVDVSSVQTFDIVVAPAVNDPPTFNIPSNINADANAGPQSFSGFVSDLSVGPTDESVQSIISLSVTANSNPEIFSSAPTINAAGDLLFTPLTVGTATITVTAVDDGGTDFGGDDTTEQTFTITITEDNLAPLLNAIANREVNEHETVSFQAIASDGNDDSLTFSLTDAPAGMSISPTGLLTWTPSEDQGGESFVFDVNVTDGAESDVLETTWTVSETNDPPTLDAIGNKSITAGQTLTFQGIEGDPDRPVQTLVYSLGSGVPDGASISAEGAFTWTPTESQVGMHSIEIIVADNGSPTKSVSETITVTVNAPVPTNTAPVLDSVGARTINEQQSFTLDIAALASDFDGDTLSFSINPTPPGATINASSGLLAWTPSEDQGGQSFTFDIIVSDGEKTDFETVTWTITETNAPPILSAIDGKSVNEGSPLTFNASATDGDDGAQSVTYSLGAGAPTGAAITPAGVFTWTPSSTQVGSHSIEIIATDDGSPAKTDSETITVTVGDVANILIVDGFDGNSGGVPTGWMVPVGDASGVVEQNSAVSLTTDSVVGIAVDQTFDLQGKETTFTASFDSLTGQAGVGVGLLTDFEYGRRRGDTDHYQAPNNLIDIDIWDVSRSATDFDLVERRGLNATAERSI